MLLQSVKQATGDNMVLDDEQQQEPSPASTAKSSLSIEEKARLRRQRLLQRGNERLSKILGHDASSLSPPVPPDIPLPGRDLAVHVTPEVIASLTNSSTEDSFSPDEISAQLSNLSLGLSSPDAGEAGTDGQRSERPAPSFVPKPEPPVKRRGGALLQLLMLVAAAAAGIVYDQPILTSFLLALPVLLLLRPSWSAPPGKLIALLSLARSVLDDLLVFIFFSILSLLLRDALPRFIDVASRTALWRHLSAATSDFLSHAS